VSHKQTGKALSVSADSIAMCARAAETDHTQRPPAPLRGVAAREGWIHLPDAESLAELPRDRTREST
jgi:hypothetical protein